MNKEILEKAILQLQDHSYNMLNVSAIYDNYSHENWLKKLEEIRNSILYLESLVENESLK